MFQNAPDIREKPHVEHMVGLINNQHFQFGKIDGTTVDMIKKPTGTGHNNISTFQFLNLRINTNATVNSSASQAGLATQSFNSLMNLFGQLSGGSHDQSTDAGRFFFDQPIQYRQNEDSRFTGAGLGQPHHIMIL